MTDIRDKGLGAFHDQPADSNVEAQLSPKVHARYLVYRERWSYGFSSAVGEARTRLAPQAFAALDAELTALLRAPGAGRSPRVAELRALLHLD